MTIIGSQIEEINAIRKNLGSTTINIKSNVEIDSIKRKKAVIFKDKKEDILEFIFKFNINYNEASSISITGTIFYTAGKKTLDNIEGQWKKKKKIDTKSVLPVLNHAMELGYKNAFSISEKLRLPTPIKLPRFVEKAKNE